MRSNKVINKGKCIVHITFFSLYYLKKCMEIKSSLENTKAYNSGNFSDY